MKTDIKIDTEMKFYVEVVDSRLTHFILNVSVVNIDKIIEDTF